MRLRATNMQPYAVTADDALWLARAVEAEGPVQAEVAATLINGFCFVRSRGYTRSLATFIRAYAQPVNPRWYPDGDLHREQLAHLKAAAGGAESGEQWAAAEAERKAAEKRVTLHSTRVAFARGTQEAVSAALNGRTQIPPNATDYAAAWIDATKKGYTALAPPTKGINRLWARGGAETWTGYLTDATDAWPWLLVIAAAGFVAWRQWGA